MQSDLEGCVEQRLCEVCGKTFAQYTCPRCQMRYCSLDCYRNIRHADCSEDFYKQEVMGSLKNRSVDPEQRQNMLELLARFEAEQIEDEEVRQLEERQNELEAALQGLSLDNEEDLDKLWQRLPDHLKRDFEQQLETGALFHNALAKPWWELGHTDSTTAAADTTESNVFPPHRPLVVVESPERHDQSTSKTDDAGAIRTADSGAQSRPELFYNMVNLLLSYVYVWRHLNGDVVRQEDSALACATTLDVCAVLNINAVCKDADSAVAQLVGLIPADAAAMCCSDVLTIMTSDRAVSKALGQLAGWFHKAKAAQVIEVLPQRAASLTKPQVRALRKKLDFYVQWWSSMLEKLAPSETREMLACERQRLQHALDGISSHYAVPKKARLSQSMNSTLEDERSDQQTRPVSSLASIVTTQASAASQEPTPQQRRPLIEEL